MAVNKGFTVYHKTWTKTNKMGATVKDEISTIEQKFCPHRSPLPILDYVNVGSNVLVLLMLIYCCSHCLWRSYFGLDPWYAVRSVVSILALIMMRKRELVALL